MASTGIQANQTDVRFSDKQLLALTQEYDANKTELVSSGALVKDSILASKYSNDTGVVERPFWFYDYEKSQDWTGKVDGETDKVGNKSIRSVMKRHFKAWKYNELAQFLATGITPEQAINNVITRHKNTALYDVVKSILKGVFANSAIQGKMIYDASTRAIKGQDFIKARAKFWKDRANEAPVFYIMHSVVYTALVTQLTETTMANFLQGARILVDDTITTESAGVYETYMFRDGAIRWTGDLPLANASAFVERDETKNQGETIIGYRRAFGFEVTNISFKGTLADPVCATDTELETGTNWEQVIDDTRFTLMGMIKSKESITPDAAMAMVSAG